MCCCCCCWSRVTTLRKRWAGQGEVRNVHETLVGEIEGKKQLEDISEDGVMIVIICYLNKVCVDVGRINLAQHTGQLGTVVNIVINFWFL